MQSRTTSQHIEIIHIDLDFPRGLIMVPKTQTQLPIFVFGSNLAGRHGAGSALEAMKNWGAIYGQGYGRQGQSFAIPTKDHNLKVLSLETIGFYVSAFKTFAFVHPELSFEIVDIGCGLAGYAPRDIAPMFAGVPSNCFFLGHLNDHVPLAK